MARLIEVDDAEVIAPRLTISPGDIVRFAASGGRVTGGDPEVLQLLGSFLKGVVSSNTQILTPQGPPTSVLFMARKKGLATIDVMTGDPFRGARKTSIEVLVD